MVLTSYSCSLVSCIFLFLILPAVIYQLIGHYFKQNQKSLVLLVLIAVTPLLCAKFYGVLLNLGLTTPKEFKSILVILALFVAAFLKDSQIISIFSAGYAQYFSKQNLVDKCLLVASIITILILLLTSWNTALVANDPLEYFKIAHYIQEYGQTKFYPLLTGENTNGFIAPWTHGLGYPLLIELFSSHPILENLNFTPKLISVFYSIICCVNLLLISNHLKLKYKFLAGFMLLATPIFYNLTFVSHIDSIRVALYMLALNAIFLTIDTKDKNSFQLILLSIIINYCALLVHSSGVVSVLTSAGLFFLFSSEGIKKKLVVSCLICSIPILIYLPKIISNIQIYGHPIGDTNNLSVLTLPSIEHADFSRAALGIEHFMDYVQIGLLSGFTKIKIFGFHYYSLAILLIYHICFVKNKAYDEQVMRSLRFFLAGFIIFYFAVLLSVLLSKIIIIKNMRYYLQVQPLVCISVAILMHSISAQVCNMYATIKKPQ